MAYKIIYNKKECIGAGECEALDSIRWKVKGDGLAELNNSREVASQIFECEIPEDQVKKQQAIAQSCPSGCIRVVKC